MESGTRDLVSAQVVLKPSSLSAAESVAKALADAGFQVGSLVANNLSITAPARKFHAYFGVTLPPPEVVPLDSVPAVVRKHIEAVIIPKPPDFGPWGNF